MSCSRQHFVDTAKKYIGYNEANGTAQQIMDLYDQMVDKTDVCSRWGCRHLYFAKQWHWCEAYVSAMAFVAGCTDVVPCEMSCWSVQQMAIKGLNGAKWIPYSKGNKSNVEIGDLVLYDWGGGHSDTDHVGIVTSVSDSGFQTVEGNTQGSGSGDNYLGKVGTRSVGWSNTVVTGFIHCAFSASGSSSTPVKPTEHSEADIQAMARRVIQGEFGNYPERKANLEALGYNYEVVQSVVNAMVNGDTAKPEYDTYTVKKGDTMYEIAKAHGIDLKQLISINPQIENPSLIFVGQIINLKEKKKEEEKPKITEHKIVSGDTFESIAKKYGITVAQLIEKNVGVVLKV